MKITTSDKLIAYLSLLSGLTVSAVAEFYSIMGLIAIFAAAPIPIIIMGVSLGISKLVATVWLKTNWTRAPILIRTYLSIAIGILMLITSMGIFGFLSKAHSDQSLVSGDVQAKISVYDEKIKTSKENIDANRKILKQLDDGVDQVMGRSTSETGADKAVAIRKSQQKERARLQAEIQTEQKTISRLNEEAAPIRAEVRKVEAEVGPIKYIAQLIYSDNPDANVLEKAVTWVIIIIVAVFDPLAVIMLLASQYSFQWFRKQEEDDEEMREEYDFSEATRGPVVEAANEDQMEEDVKEFFEKGKLIAKVLDYEEAERLAKEANEKLSEIEKPEQEFIMPDPIEYVSPEIIAQVPTPVESIQIEVPVVEELVDETENAPQHVKVAMAAWKIDFPEDSLKHQRKLFEDGIIKELPWNLPPYTLEPVADIDRPGDYLKESDTKTWLEMDGNRQVRKSTEELVAGYEQNAEQNAQTLWNRIQASKE